MDLRNHRSIILLSLIFFNYLVIPSLFISGAFDLSIERGKSIIWEDKVVNKNLIEQLILQEDYDEEMLHYEVGEQLRWDIIDISNLESDDIEYWEFNIDYLIGKDLMNSPAEPEYSAYYYIEKNPSDLATEWDSTSSISLLKIVPTNTANYLTTFITELSAEYSHISFNNSLLIENNTKSIGTDTIIVEYNDEGILKNFSLYYYNSLAYQFVLIGVYDTPIDLVFIITLIIIMSSVISICAVMGLVKRKKAMSNRKAHDKTMVSAEPIKKSSDELKLPREEPKEDFFGDISKTSSESEILVSKEKSKLIKTCNFCGEERDSDAKFCPYCGKNFK